MSKRTKNINTLYALQTMDTLTIRIDRTHPPTGKRLVAEKRIPLGTLVQSRKSEPLAELIVQLQYDLDAEERAILQAKPNLP